MNRRARGRFGSREGVVCAPDRYHPPTPSRGSRKRRTPRCAQLCVAFYAAQKPRGKERTKEEFPESRKDAKQAMPVWA